MENASKALLIAGGALVSILVVTLFLYAYSKISEYQTNKEELFNTEDLAKFNEQFTVYDRKDLKGHEVISLINKVRDYNERYATKGSYSNNSYNPIKLKIHLESFDFTEDNNPILFSKGPVDYDIDSWENIERLYNLAKNNLPNAGVINDEIAGKIARDIRTIFLDDSATEEAWEKSVRQYNAYTGTKYDKSWAKANLKKGGGFYNDACTCYEYMQFKKAIFKCQKGENDSTSGISYDPVTGRVVGINIVLINE